METQILNELASIRAYLFLGMLAMTAVAIAAIIIVIGIYRANRQLRQVNDFFVRGNTLLLKGDLEKLLELCRERIREYPADAGAFSLMGAAHYRRKEWNDSLICYRKVDELQPGCNLGPSIAEIEEKIASSRTSPDLKVVSPATPISNTFISKDGSNTKVDV